MCGTTHTHTHTHIPADTQAPVTVLVCGRTVYPSEVKAFPGNQKRMFLAAPVVLRGGQFRHSHGAQHHISPRILSSPLSGLSCIF